MVADGVPTPFSATVVEPVELPMLMAVEALEVVIPAPLFNVSSAVSRIRLEPVETVSLTPLLMMICAAANLVVPVAPGENCCDPVNVRIFGPADTVMVPELPPEKLITPDTPPSAKSLALWSNMLPPLFVEVIVPALLYPELPATFN